jgi:Chlorophyll A-B binding protein
MSRYGNKSIKNVAFLKIFVILVYIRQRTLKIKFGVRTMTNASTTKVTTPVIEDRNAWRWGFTPQAEIWNGRLAMIGFLAAILVEVFSGQGFLHFWGIL